MVQTTDRVEARQVERPVLFVECPTETGALCQALVRSIAVHVPHHVIRLDPAPAGAKFLRVTFHVAQDVDLFSGYLSWRVPGGAMGQGPVHQLAGGNVVTSSIAAQEFAQALVSKSPELQSILAASK
ncbi:hypothetical protein GCM10007385_44020 [Tateyamaria omphalii]|uniref:hypothetical protein n=1 Tax=Tateyamaria omphalii TaxID=299262 RepID=UPI0016752487|nr:hypothetical protein [Tateyamaria omphalii]GGX70215.1 hypothetical protein GCM10007385_44020 [Tateyamaria omphalii]